MTNFIVRRTNCFYEQAINPMFGINDTKIFDTYDEAITFVKKCIEYETIIGGILSCYYDVLNENEELKRLYIVNNKTKGITTIYFEILKEETLEKIE